DSVLHLVRAWGSLLCVGIKGLQNNAIRTQSTLVITLVLIPPGNIDSQHHLPHHYISFPSTPLSDRLLPIMDHYYECDGVQYRLSLVYPLNETGHSTEPSFSFQCEEKRSRTFIWIIIAVVLSPYLIYFIFLILYCAAGIAQAVYRVFKQSYKSLKDEIATRYERMHAVAAAKKVMIWTIPEPSAQPPTLSLSSSASSPKDASDDVV
ncbi:hypothetical protein EDD21DRAFT_143097, partial [Dissophora ornata]